MKNVDGVNNQKDISFILQFLFKVKHFFIHPKFTHLLLKVKRKHVYITFEMRFKDKAYGLNLLLTLVFYQLNLLQKPINNILLTLC
jgi:hypothetical protein